MSEEVYGGPDDLPIVSPEILDIMNQEPLYERIFEIISEISQEDVELYEKIIKNRIKLFGESQ